MTVARLLVLVVLLATFHPVVQPAGAAHRLQNAGPTADPASAAVFYSQLEAEGRFSELYAHMHPDAQAIIPEAAVVGWYRDNFAPLGPGVITVTGVLMVPWTWEVTGVTYPQTTEVSFQQPFADGSVANEVVRLVEHEGQWRWFFGRSRDFVDEQIAKYGTGQVVTGGSCDGAAEWWAETNPRIGIAQYRAFTLPSAWNGGAGQEWALRDHADGFAMLHEQQAASIPPPAATALHDDFLSALVLYEYAAGTMADLASGAGNPLGNSAWLAEAAEALDRADQTMQGLEGRINVFLETCEPLVVFVPTLGGDTPPAPVFPGGPEPEGYMPVECWLFEAEPERAQRFYEAAGPGDPHGLDSDGDGIACEVGE